MVVMGKGMHEQSGFTIVELLIVVVVIAILATITIVAYNGITTQARESTMKAELGSAAKQLQLTKVDKGVYPENTNSLVKSKSVVFQYDATVNTFCLTATSSALPGKAFHVTHDGVVRQGACSGHNELGMIDVRALGDKMVVGWASHDLVTLADDESKFNSRNGMLSTYTDFVQSPDFPVSYLEAAETRGAALLIALEPWDWDAPINQQPSFAPRNIAAGAHDAHITAWFQEAQSYAHRAQIIVRFAPEMNDSARPWASGIGTIGYSESTPAEYIAMWRHVAAIRDSVAPGVLLMWNPLNYGAGPYPFEDFYPGDQYVDVLALNGFNWSDQHPTSAGWQDSSAVFGFNDAANGPVPRIKALAGSKPWGIAETASAPDVPSFFQSGGKFHSSYGSWVFEWPENPPYEQTANDWITQEGWTRMLIKRSYDAGAGFVSLFHTNKETDWRLTDTATGRAVISSSRAWNANIIGSPR